MEPSVSAQCTDGALPGGRVPEGTCSSPLVTLNETLRLRTRREHVGTLAQLVARFVRTHFS